jgi:hypothetical protein
MKAVCTVHFLIIDLPYALHIRSHCGRQCGFKGNRSMYITSQTGLCDEYELFINRFRCYATVPLIDNAIAGCVGTGLGRVRAA